MLIGGEPAHAAIPLARVEIDSSVALAGETALFRRGKPYDFRVLSVPVDGSAPAKKLVDVPEDHEVLISASPQRAAISVYSPGDMYVLTGPPAGPFSTAPASPRGLTPYVATVDHDVLFIVEADEDLYEFRHVVIEPGVPPRPLGLPGFPDTVAFEGDLVAYNTSGESNVFVRNWRTGAERTIVFPEPPDQVDVRADGAVVATSNAGNVYSVAPDGPPKLLTRDGERAEFAGERIVYVGGDLSSGGIHQLFAVDADGHTRKIGVPSVTLFAFIADEKRVLWTANGCLLVADLSEPVASGPAAGPCARSEVAVISEREPVRRDRTVRVRLRCVAAPETCRGTLHLTLHGMRGRSSTVRFSIPAGGRATVTPRLTRAAYAAARHKASVPHDVGEGGIGVVAHVVAVDPQGRRSRYTGEFAGRVR